MNILRHWFAPARRFARPPEKKNHPAPFFALHGLADAGLGAGDAGTLARQGFARNPVVYRCVRMISEAAASMPWLLFDAQDEVEGHPVLDLLARPNERQAGPEFLEALYGHLLIAGNAYIHALAAGDPPRELHLLRPDCVTPVPGPDGWPVAWDYTSGARRTRIEAGGDPPPLCHVALFNPADEVTGLPPMAAARNALGIHEAASRWNRALLDNAARPSGALVYTAAENGNLTDEQFERLKQELENGYAGAANAGRPMVLEGGLDWKAMGFSPRDMDFIQAKHGAARDIALAFGVPPMLLGIPGDNTYANYAEANRAFWRQTVLPLAGRIAGSLGTWLGAWFGDDTLRLEFDRDRVEALSPDRDGLWKRLNEATFLTVDEKREAAGYGPAPEDEFTPPLPESPYDLGGNPESKYNFDPNQPRLPAGVNRYGLSSK